MFLLRSQENHDSFATASCQIAGAPPIQLLLDSMSFKTTLFQALSAADFTTCNGRSVVSKYLDTSPQALLKPYVDLADDTTVYIENAEILVDDVGRAYCNAADGQTEPLVWVFRVVAPLTQSNVTAILPSAPRVRQMLSRIKEIERADKRYA